MEIIKIIKKFCFLLFAFASSFIAFSSSLPEKVTGRGLIESTSNQEEESLNDTVVTPQPGLDFIIAGFPKCGTSSLRILFESHNETVILHKFIRTKEGKIQESEYFLWDESDFTTLREQLLKSSSQRRAFLHGVKWPMALVGGNINFLKELQRFNPKGHKTKIIVGMRHPVKWFESFYNYRKRQYADFPPIEALVGSFDVAKLGLYSDLSRYETNIMQLGKTDLFGEQLQWLAQARYRVVENPYRVLFYTLEQIQDDNLQRRRQFLIDLQEFMEIGSSFKGVPWANKFAEIDFAGKVNICDSQYVGIRSKLVVQGNATATWITDVLANGMDVTFAGGGYFFDSVKKWGLDPCY